LRFRHAGALGLEGNPFEEAHEPQQVGLVHYLLSLGLTPEAVLSLDGFNEIACANASGLLVLDDYHVVHSPPVHAAVTFLLDHLPPGLHLVVASREDPPLPLPRLRAGGQLVELRGTDLGSPSRRRTRCSLRERG